MLYICVYIYFFLDIVANRTWKPDFKKNLMISKSFRLGLGILVIKYHSPDRFYLRMCGIAKQVAEREPRKKSWQDESSMYI